MTSAAPPTGPALYLIDGYALIYRAFFALLSRPLTTARGENTSAAWGVVNFLQRLTRTYQPTHVAWVQDSGRSFRHVLHPTYKATREKLTEELQADFDRGVQRIEELLQAFHIPTIAISGFEADDVIGTLARQATARNMNVVIVSGDKDFQQCVDRTVWLLNPGRGGPAGVDEQFIHTTNANERLGVGPEFVTDYLALVGDASDNVPGVPGIGEKTARELIAKYGDLTSILANANEVSKKRPREALVAYAEQARLSKDLVTIRYDVPIALELENLRVRPPDLVRLRQLFLDLEFTTLLKTIEIGTVPAKEREIGTCTVADTADAVATALTQYHKGQRIALGVYTVAEPNAPSENDPLLSILVGLCFAMEPSQAWYFPLRHRSPMVAQGDLLSSSSTDAEVTQIAEGVGRPINLPSLGSPEMQALREIIEDETIPKTVHDSKTVCLVLERAGVRLSGVDFDTMLGSYVLDPGRRAHSLELLGLEFLDQEVVSEEALLGKGRGRMPFDRVAVQNAATFAGEHTRLVLRLQVPLSAQLRQQGLLPLFETIELPLVEVLAGMETRGIRIDLEWFRSLKQRFRSERERVEQEIYDVAGERFNINSNQQLRTILFSKMQLPVKKRTSTGPSTDASVLQELAEEGHALPVLLMEYRELAKLESTYVDALPRLVSPVDGRIHTSFNQTVAATGRLSSSDPNLQNIPVRRQLGRDIRRGFVASPGCLLLAADYSQIELRILAHLSGDPGFVEAFKRGGDIHRETAAIIFGTPPNEVTSDMRARAKTINFATIYGQGAVALARQLKISNSEAKAFIAMYFERFRGVRDYLDAQVAFAREHGFVETIFSRRRYIPELKDRNFNIRAFGERVATNAPIQGSAADLIKIAMISIHRRIEAEHRKGRMLLQVHDELVFEIPEDERTVMEQLVREAMEGAAQLSVPLLVDVGVGENWLETKHS